MPAQRGKGDVWFLEFTVESLPPWGNCCDLMLHKKCYWIELKPHNKHRYSLTYLPLCSFNCFTSSIKFITWTSSFIALWPISVFMISLYPLPSVKQGRKIKLLCSYFFYITFKSLIQDPVCYCILGHCWENSSDIHLRKTAHNLSYTESDMINDELNLMMELDK